MRSIGLLDPAVRAQPVVGVEDKRSLWAGAEPIHPSLKQARVVNVAVIEDGDEFRLGQGDSATHVRRPPS